MFGQHIAPGNICHNKFFVIMWLRTFDNRPFPSRLNSLFQRDTTCKSIDMNFFFIPRQIKLIFTRKVLHLASF